MTEQTATYLLLVWLFGALIGGVGTTLYLYWSLATGRRTVRPLPPRRDGRR